MPVTVFLDDGGVLNDNARRGPQWRRLLGEFLPPVLGGSPESWAEANRALTDPPDGVPLWERFLERTFGTTDVSFARYERAYAAAWVRGMSERVGVLAPDDDGCLSLLREASAYVTPRVRSAIPGAAEAVRELHARGVVLHTASNEASYDLEGYLTGMEVRGCFGTLYGPDLVDILKDGPEYYRRVLADARVHAPDAVIVDDRPDCVGWAARLGAGGAGRARRAAGGSLGRHWLAGGASGAARGEIRRLTMAAKAVSVVPRPLPNPPPLAREREHAPWPAGSIRTCSAASRPRADAQCRHRPHSARPHPS